MKKTLIVVGVIVAAVIVCIAGVLVYFVVKYPDAGPPPEISVTATPERLARGEYLVRHVAACIDCHSKRDWTLFSGPAVPGTEGEGGERYTEEDGYPGTIAARNITPSGIGSLTDGELLRAITSGVRKDNQVLFPVMPYPFYKEFSEEDLFSVIAYLRTLKPIRHDVPESSIRFPVNVFIRAVPSRYVPVGNSDTTNRVEYGKYLATIAACSMCHTPMEKGEPVKGQEFAGGSEFRVPRGVVRSANLTPDEETGIGLWTPDIFVAKFKQFDSEEGRTTDPATMGYQSVMPWTLYAGMTESDLAAIYAYLRTLPALTNNVIRFTPQK